MLSKAHSPSPRQFRRGIVSDGRSIAGCGCICGGDGCAFCKTSSASKSAIERVPAVRIAGPTLLGSAGPDRTMDAKKVESLKIRRGAPALDGGRPPFAADPLRLPALPALPGNSERIVEAWGPTERSSSSSGRQNMASTYAPRNRSIAAATSDESSQAPVHMPTSSRRARQTSQPATRAHGARRHDTKKSSRTPLASCTTESKNVSCQHVIVGRRRSNTWAQSLDLSCAPCTVVSPTGLSPNVSSLCGSAVPSMDSADRVAEVCRVSRDEDIQLPSPCAGRWQRGSKIGQGSYGSVFKALDKQTGRIFVVKTAAFGDGGEDDRIFCDKLQDELRICKELRHPHIVSYLGNEHIDGTLYIFLEYVSGGSLSSVLAEFGPLDGESVMRTTACGLLAGLNYLHTRPVPIVHRDIKGANVLVHLNFCVKLADFGCSKRSFNTRSLSTVGSLPWMAPEVIEQKDGHGRKADVWSLGCTLIEMATADKPWGRDMFDNIIFAMRQIGFTENTPSIPGSLPLACQDFIGLCVMRLPNNRPSTVELLGHAFVRASAVLIS
eukprot:TRINITY_DN16724_c0_g1_i1.p1 TRINITY_DN16724_c0_g1~~TRINITY_DN16724_c0_g1_i1.p1  ORF type:complete len:551 (-),score=51.51 TRINITY_DN16724_c0_g1_i1:432-2084(-)